MTPNKKLKIAVIGVGHLGKFHTQKYAQMPGVELMGIVDIDSPKVSALADQYNTRAYTDYRQIMGGIEAASLAVPTALHHDLALDLLRAGIHLLIEKPITFQLADADRLIALAKEQNLVLQIGHIERFNPAVVQMQKWIDRPFLFKAERLSPFTVRGTDVDVVLDLMIHDLDIILHTVKSKIREISATGVSVVTDKIDMADTRLIFENGVTAHLTASRFADKPTRRIRIFQAASYLAVDCMKREISITRMEAVTNRKPDKPSIRTESLNFTDRDPLADEIHSFVNAVIQGTEPAVTGSDGRDALQTALMISAQIMKGLSHSKSSR
jgi:predicted dehydrogenase